MSVILTKELYSETFAIAEKDYNEWLEHYGTPRHSGRYPWGSGENPYQSAANFYWHVKRMKDEGVSETDIAAAMNMTTTQLRARYTLARNEKRMAEVNRAQDLIDKGYSQSAAARELGVNESTLRSYLDDARKQRSEKLNNTANALREAVEKQGPIDVGRGTEARIGVTETMKKNAVALLEAEGYNCYNIKTYQMGTGKQTTIQVLAPKDMSFADVAKNKTKIQTPGLYCEDPFGNDIRHIEDPVRIKKDRIQIKYGDEGGVDRDGLIEIRPGVKDLSLGKNHYAQVRIGVDGDLYLKGMAVYSDDLPDGVDIRFNTNKKSGTPFEKVLKPMKKVKDPATGEDTDTVDIFNPFGAAIKTQMHYGVTDKNPKGKLGAVNIVNEEGDWATWSHNLPSQFLSKQPIDVVRKQLGKAASAKDAEFEELNSLTNPVVKAKMLNDYAESCDSAAVHLKAAAFPRQATHVILPFTSLKDTEIYAPDYKDGEYVALVRYPHAGRFEMPIVKVNNKNPECRKTLGNTHDAVGINSKVAARLSGADFDGDTVTVIPIRGTGIKNSPELSGLKNFDPGKYAVPDSDWYHTVTKKDKDGKSYSTKVPMVTDARKQLLMGEVSNLITDMTIKGADDREIERAVRHSMVVIDCVKHHYDYRQSYKDNGIAELSAKYQGSTRGGASTLISKAKSDKRVDDYRIKIDPATGKKRYIYTGKTYTDKDGNIKKSTIKTTKMAWANDAYSLSSGSQVENIYADYANHMKTLANESRKAALGAKGYTYSPAAAKTYAIEVARLNAALQVAEAHKPVERKAQVIAGYKYSQYIHDNPHASDDEKKKKKGQYLEAARNALGGGKTQIVISDKEWEAIQAGAISKTKLTAIINNTDPDRLKSLATPRAKTVMSPAHIARAKAMDANGATLAEIADALGVSTSTVSAMINE